MPVQTQTNQLASGVQLSRTGDRCVLFNGNTGTAIVLNPTGTILAELLEKSQTTPELTRELEQRFTGIDNAQATADVSAFLTQLHGHKMLASEQ